MAFSRKTVATPQKNAGSEQRADRAPKRFQLILTTCLAAFLTASICCAPEGAIREGDYVPIAMLFFLLCIGATWGFYRTSRLSQQPQKKVESDAAKAQGNAEESSVKNRVVCIADLALGAYLIWCVFSCLKVALFHTGDVRFTLNGFWTFVTPALFYLFLRFFSKIISQRVLIELCLVVGACMLAESVFSLYSYAVVNPRVRAAYRADPDRLLAENEMSFEKGSRERLLFEKRLLDSVEPTGTYGLANTLAGALAPTLVLALVGIPWLRLFSNGRRLKGASRRLYWLRVVLLTLSALLALFILLTTKSRSAYLACGAAMAVWFVLWLLNRAKSSKKLVRTAPRFIIVGVVLLTIASAAAIFSGAIDREVFTEAGKSFCYRVQYWIATSEMIRDNVLFGVGPGEFQSLYARYILPTASEFIADPHNFAFEICALFGVPALIAFAVFLIATFGSSCFASKDVADSSSPSLNSDSTDSKSHSRALRVATLMGVALGLVATFCCSSVQSTPVDWNFYWLAVLSLTVFFYAASVLSNEHDEKTSGRATPALVAALVALLINLCAAGGIGYPPIAVILFLFAATLNNRASGKQSTEADMVAKDKKKGTSALYAFVASIAIFGVFYATSYKPWSSSLLFKLNSVSDSEWYLETMRSGRVNKIDLASSSVALQYYYFSGMEFAKNASAENKMNWQEARKRIETVSPNSSPLRESCGDFDMLLYEKYPIRAEFLESAVSFYQEAVDRSPTDASKKEKLFDALGKAGRSDEALAVAKAALEFDKITPHEDRKLSEESRLKMNAFIDGSQ